MIKLSKHLILILLLLFSSLILFACNNSNEENTPNEENTTTYTISWVVDGQTIEVDEVEEGLLPTFAGVTPTKTVGEHTYVLYKWEPSIVVASENATYDAVFTEIIYEDISIGEVKVTGFLDNTLTELIIPEYIDGKYVTEVAANIFYNFSLLEKLTLPFLGQNRTSTDGHGSLGILFGQASYENSYDANTFYIPNGLKEIIITDTQLINKYAFRYCSSLVSVSIPESVGTIEALAFLSCTNLLEIIVDENSANFSAIDGVLFNKDHTSLLVYPIGKTQNTYTIINTVTSIWDYAFASCTNIEYIIFETGSQLTAIRPRAFQTCTSLKEIVIPNTVTHIYNYAFSGCISLESIVFVEGSQLQNISTYAFAACFLLTTIVIPNTVVTINAAAFQSCYVLTIFAEATSKPEGWVDNWNDSGRPVYWGGTWTLVDGVPTPN